MEYIEIIDRYNNLPVEKQELFKYFVEYCNYTKTRLRYIGQYSFIMTLSRDKLRYLQFMLDKLEIVNTRYNLKSFKKFLVYYRFYN